MGSNILLHQGEDVRNNYNVVKEMTQAVHVNVPDVVLLRPCCFQKIFTGCKPDFRILPSFLANLAPSW